MLAQATYPRAELHASAFFWAQSTSSALDNGTLQTVYTTVQQPRIFPMEIAPDQ
jgi:hypothetical protein